MYNRHDALELGVDTRNTVPCWISEHGHMRKVLVSRAELEPYLTDREFEDAPHLSFLLKCRLFEILVVDKN